MYHNTIVILKMEGFPGGAVVESLPANAGDTGSSPGLGRTHMPHSKAKKKKKMSGIGKSIETESGLVVV